jgi:hypothetical protein
MEWYARILSDVRVLQPTTVRALQRTFEAIEREAKGNPVSLHWRDVVNTIANVLSASPEQRSSPPYRRLEAFMLENGDLPRGATILNRFTSTTRPAKRVSSADWPRADGLRAPRRCG